MSRASIRILRDGRNGTDADDWSVLPDGSVAAPLTFSDRLFCWESFATPPDSPTEPYTLQWFLAIEHHRHSRTARWIPGLLEFNRHAGETLLGLGNGLGTDWIQYARQGANVIACSPIHAELDLIRRNFELRGLNGRFVHADPSTLPLEDASVDVACISGLLHELPTPAAVVQEVHRVLKPGGKVLAIVPGKYNIDFWRPILWPWSQAVQTLLGRSPWRPAPVTSSGAAFSARRLKKLFHGFENHRVHKRQLSRREIPWAYRWLPRALLERLLGRFLILKAFKPVTSSVSQRRPLAA
jgi:SAM-dependent methyltransferase